jgi:hypothetical protein
VPLQNIVKIHAGTKPESNLLEVIFCQATITYIRNNFPEKKFVLGEATSFTVILPPRNAGHFDI